MIDQFLELLARGGVVMGIIFCISVYMIAVIVYKTNQFYRMQSINPLFIRQLESDVDPKALRTYLTAANFEQNPVANVMLSSLTLMEESQFKENSYEIGRQEVSRVASIELRYLQRHMRGLELVANISPLLGLLGTVIGMVDAFAALEQAGTKVDPSLLAGGIWTALLTTVAGLCVAIPALTAFNIFDEKIETVRVSMRDVAIRIFSMKGRGQDSKSKTEEIVKNIALRHKGRRSSDKVKELNGDMA